MTSLATAPKTLSQAASLVVIPPPHGIPVIPHSFADPEDPQFSVPIFDFAALTSGSSEERSRLICELGEVCRNWGFFMLTNHGVSESLTNGMMEAFDRFFKQPEEIKRKGLREIHSPDPFEYKKSYMIGSDKNQHLSEFYIVRVHPEFHLINDTVGFSEASKEFGTRTREVEARLIEAISQSLGFEGNYIHKTLNLDEAHQSVAGNYYPPCPQTDLADGIVPHTDGSLITLLADNGISGLQVEHNGKWVKVESKISNSFWVLGGDHMQIFTNGKYKSVIHRACGNDRAKRMSVVIPFGPPVDTIVAPSLELLKKEGQRPFYEALTFAEYITLKRTRGVIKTIE